MPLQEFWPADWAFPPTAPWLGAAVSRERFVKALAGDPRAARGASEEGLGAWFFDRGLGLIANLDAVVTPGLPLNELYGFDTDLEGMVGCTGGELLAWEVWPPRLPAEPLTTHYLMLFTKQPGDRNRYNLYVISNERCEDDRDRCLCGHLVYAFLSFRRAPQFKPGASARTVAVRYYLETIYGRNYPRFKNGTGYMYYEIALDPEQFKELYETGATSYFDGLVVSEGYTHSGGRMGLNYRQVTPLTAEMTCPRLADEFGRTSGGLFERFAGANPSLPSIDKRDPGYWMIELLAVYFVNDDTVWFRGQCEKYALGIGGVTATDPGGPGTAGSP